MSNPGAATVAGAEGEEVNRKAEMESIATAVSEGTVKCNKRKKKKKRKQAVENGTVKQEVASVAAAVLEGTTKSKKRRRKHAVENAKENGTVEQEAASVTAAVLEGTPKSKEEVKAKERVMTEQEADTTAVSALEETPKCKKKKAKERGMVEQGTDTPAVSTMEGTPKCKEEGEKGKERGMAEQEATTATVSALEGTPKCNKKKEKAKERGIAEQEATTTTTFLALEGTLKCKKKKEKAKETIMDEPKPSTTISALEGTKKYKIKGEGSEAGLAKKETTAAVSASEWITKRKRRLKQKNKKEQQESPQALSGLVVVDKIVANKPGNGGTNEERASRDADVSMDPKNAKDPNCSTILASEGIAKHKRRRLKQENKKQEQQESAQALSGLIVVDKIVANKPGNGGTNEEGAPRDADVSMDPINAEDPNCSKASDANDKVKCKAQEGNRNCSEKFSSLQECSEDRKRPKRKRKQDVSGRGPDTSSQDGGRVAKCYLDSSMDHDLNCTCTSCLVQAHKDKVKNIYSPRGSLIRFQRKKLLILDLNGLLADINMDNQNAHMAHAKVKGKLVFRRPYCDDFLRFCFQNFELGIWSSRKMENVNSVVDILMPDLKQYLLFCWDMSKCTFTGRKVIGDKHKPLVLKELKKLWNEDPDLPWEQGEFSPSNTLLVDDSPYKALCNPPHTAIFPQPYSYLNQKDDYSLGPGGDLRVYLERLAVADDVQVFVRDNPFGQPSITESDPKWNFYSKIVNKVEQGLSLKWKCRKKKPA